MSGCLSNGQLAVPEQSIMEGGDVLAFAIVVEGATVGERQAHVPLVKDQVC